MFGVCGDMAPVKYHIPARRNASSAVDGEDSWMQRVSDLFARRASEHAQYNSYTCAMRSSVLRTCMYMHVVSYGLEPAWFVF